MSCGTHSCTGRKWKTVQNSCDPEIKYLLKEVRIPFCSLGISEEAWGTGLIKCIISSASNYWLNSLSFPYIYYIYTHTYVYIYTHTYVSQPQKFLPQTSLVSVEQVLCSPTSMLEMASEPHFSLEQSSLEFIISCNSKWLVFMLQGCLCRKDLLQ